MFLKQISIFKDWDWEELKKLFIYMEKKQYSETNKIYNYGD